MLLALLAGLIIGFVGSMPIAGPVAVIVLDNGLAGRIRRALNIAVGAAAAEAIYASMAFYGLSFVLEAHPNVLPVARVLGALLIILLGGYFLFRRRGPDDPSAHPRDSGKSALFIGFTMTALNPTLLATWSGAVAAVHAMGLGVTPQLGALPFGIGALVGVASWFALWLAVLRKFRKRIQPATIDQVVRGMGALLVVLGGWAAVRSLLRPG